MQEQLLRDDLFSSWLAGEHRAAAQAWQLPTGSRAAWQVAVVNAPENEIRSAIASHPRLYLLVVNADQESVVGGDPVQLDQVTRSQGWSTIPLEGVTAVHCSLVEQVADRYKDLHLWPVHEPIAAATLHSTATGKALTLVSNAMAESILQQARAGFHFPHLIRSLWQAGSRIFIEPGP
ncbi:MAG: hypothetical protein GY917_11420, partial [Planctomycetaceae bacterium]|nr:hypothetical protein [Planctomycetaceae bacterium]